MRRRKFQQRVVRAPLHARCEAVSVRQVAQDAGGARHVRVEVARRVEVLVQAAGDELVVAEVGHSIVALRVQRLASGGRPGGGCGALQCCDLSAAARLQRNRPPAFSIAGGCYIRLAFSEQGDCNFGSMANYMPLAKDSGWSSL